MPLETRVDADPDSLHATAEWLKQRLGVQQSAGDEINGARNDTNGTYHGQAADGLRDVAGQLMRMVETATTGISGLSDACNTHAEDIKKVKEQMQHAVQVARDGGLTVNGTVIEEPGPAPAPAPQRPPGAPCTPQDNQAGAAAQQAAADYQRKLQAYAEASKIVEAARGKEIEAQHAVMRFVNGLMDPVKLSLTLGSTTTSLATDVAKDSSKYFKVAQDASKKAAQWAPLAENTTMSLAGRTKAAAVHAEHALKASESMKIANATRTTAVLKHAPDWAINRLGATLVSDTVLPKMPSGVLKGAAKVGSKIPVVGTVLTGAGIAYDAAQGKNVAKSATSGVSSLVAGSVVGTAIGGPVGTVVGGLVGVGVGFAADEVWSWFD